MKKGMWLYMNAQFHKEPFDFRFASTFFVLNFLNLVAWAVGFYIHPLVFLGVFLLQNFFMPQVKLIEKIRVGGKYKRKHSEPKTPYHRVLECPQISDETKQKLIQKYGTLNPFHLRETIEIKLKRIWELQRTFETSNKLKALTPA